MLIPKDGLAMPSQNYVYRRSGRRILLPMGPSRLQQSRLPFRHYQSKVKSSLLLLQFQLKMSPYEDG